MAKVGVGSDAIDIKKAGIFPIVHGMRTMAMDRGILATSTAGRIEALVEAGAFAPASARSCFQRAAGLHGIPPAGAAGSGAARHAGARGDGAARRLSAGRP